MNYVKSLSKQFAPKGNSRERMAPGPVWTPLQVSGGAGQEKLKEFGSKSVLGSTRSAGGISFDLCATCRE